MDRRPDNATVQVVYYARETPSSLGWLILSIFLGGTGLAVYLTIPHAPVANLVLALILGIPPFLLSLADLGKSRALILRPGSRRFRFVEGFFARRTVREFSYDEVREVHLLQKTLSTEGGSTSWVEIRLVLAGHPEILLEETSTVRANRCARELGAAFGIQPLLGVPSWASPPRPLGHPGRSSLTRVAIWTLFLAVGAVVIVLCSVLVLLHYLGH